MNLSTRIKQLSDPFDSEDADKAVHRSSPWPYGGGAGGGNCPPPPNFLPTKKIKSLNIVTYK